MVGGAAGDYQSIVTVDKLSMLTLMLLAMPCSGFVVPSLLHYVGARSAIMADRTFSAAEAKGGVDVDLSKTAMLFIEYQNEFTTDVKGCMPKPEPKSQQGCRAPGAPSFAGRQTSRRGEGLHG